MSQRHMLFMLGGAAVGYFFGNKADSATPPTSTLSSKAILYAALGAAAGWFAAKYV